MSKRSVTNSKQQSTSLSGKSGSASGPRPSHHKRRSTIMITDQLRFFTDTWVMEEPIGQPGAFGIAYICHRREQPDKKFVVKQISKAKFYHIDPKERDGILKNMSNEIKLQKTLNHDNICILYDTYEDRNYIHLVMDFLEGGELFDRICEEDGFSEAKAAKIARQILDAISFMHRQNICHLDLKPDNILFETEDENSNIKVIDFGMAQVVPRLKKLKQVVGTPYYTAPEVLSGNYDRAADIWSIGVMIFCMLFGYPPHYVDIDDIKMGESEEEAIYNLVKQGFCAEVKEGYGPWFPKDIPVSKNARDLLTKMLTFDVKDRVTAEEALTHPWIRGGAEDKKLPRTVFQSLTQFKNTTRFKVIVSQLFAKKLDPQRTAETMEVFKKWDKNKDGELTLEEFRAGMKEATRLGDDEIDRIFKELDQDDNRVITVDELIVSSAFAALVAVDERLFDAFSEMDKDGDGFIEVKELKQAIKQLKLQDLGRAESIMDEIKTLKKGKINYEEFLRALHPTLNEMNPSDMDRLRTRGFGTMDETEFSKYVNRATKAQLVEGILDANFLMKSVSVDVFGSYTAPPALVEESGQETWTSHSKTRTGTVLGSSGGLSRAIDENEEENNETLGKAGVLTTKQNTMIVNDSGDENETNNENDEKKYENQQLDRHVQSTSVDDDKSSTTSSSKINSPGGGCCFIL